MKRLLILLTVCLILAGCGPVELMIGPLPVPKFQRGDVVTLKIAGCGQILDTYIRFGEVYYLVRIPTEDGPCTSMLYEFELDAYPAE